MTRSKKIFVASVASSLLLLLFLVFGIVPLVGAIMKTTGELKTEQQKLLQLEAQQKALEDFRHFKLQNEENLEEFQTMFVASQNPSPFFGFLENLARAQGFSLRITPQEPKHLPEDRWPSIDFQISARTTFPRMYSFLEKLESGPYLVAIRNLQVTEKDEEVEFSLFFKVYSK
ncbi:MAG: hypothetical protein A2842_02365 [Candidatus Wildermuthbacteria bacterium RIFCSPHIGHO2_01_FULL_48_25]|uniref:Uncharacterized protein n=1 Tax=Candidatus Wildermuthbacteria bacterium RIFCSPLOWO2_01_FULL_48_16 TaxID=1802461 RepID=A0A1G2RL45_9BACT|nr:MAG: hypothetical protein A2842_02365 [Candidatus Wildermuthbacteria bacterium RIFCSPHIGHO2_01_FULL_48_25]OHA69319.1 MAG: hypothetical protein A3J57_00305 [Candidatus Wildermuthbacteria bacterium RIFCSPHIGHO2_02_FULL_49_12b]OHA73208.1 MAG: hypothetical protein A3B24_01090 [Candidatus Wildermuthbacteria bacterium RIFCSPLOWO2_01_FULL_48_16]